MAKITITKLLAKKGIEPITCLTAYDYLSAKVIDEAGIDLILVGDSLGMVMQGNNDTISVTLEEMIYHGKIVRKAVQNAFLVVDMPFGACSLVEDGVRNAVRLVRETRADAIKVEGADEVTLEITKKLYNSGINVMGHVGLQPQMVNVMGGFTISGYDNTRKVMNEAKALQEAGARLIVLEGMDSESAQEITSVLNIPTIGIGAGVNCDGQVLVFHDIFGFSGGKVPKFVKKYADVYTTIKASTEQYISEVKDKIFPNESYSYKKH